MAERKFTRGLNKPGMAAQLRETVSQVVRESAVLVSGHPLVCVCVCSCVRSVSRSFLIISCRVNITFIYVLIRVSILWFLRIFFPSLSVRSLFSHCLSTEFRKKKTSTCIRIISTQTLSRCRIVCEIFNGEIK